MKLRLNDSTLPIARSYQYFIDLDSYLLTDKLSDINDTNNRNWFPDKHFAEKWLEFVNTGTVSDTTPPSEPPYNVLLRDEGQSIVISWQAVADVESGIKDFRIYRNDKLINMGSDRSEWNFQFDYHDNPIKIYDKFEFVDNNINSRKKYNYQVSVVNNAGLESERSEAVFN